MKQEFENPFVEVIEFDEKDVIATSPEDTQEPEQEDSEG
jgi:hypothetical protein